LATSFHRPTNAYAASAATSAISSCFWCNLTPNLAVKQTRPFGLSSSEPWRAARRSANLDRYASEERLMESAMMVAIAALIISFFNSVFTAKTYKKIDDLNSSKGETAYPRRFQS
jgi:hypothetical protein